jgi:hypothetical protein
VRRSLFFARDWAGNVSNFPREVTETALAHFLGDKAEQAYGFFFSRLLLFWPLAYQPLMYRKRCDWSPGFANSGIGFHGPFWKGPWRRTSPSGRRRRFRDVGCESALPPRTDIAS